MEFLGERINALLNCGWPGVDVWVPGRLKLQVNHHTLGGHKDRNFNPDPTCQVGGPEPDSEHGQASFPPLYSGIDKYLPYRWLEGLELGGYKARVLDGVQGQVLGFDGMGRRWAELAPPPKCYR